jgi:ribulose-5-phosphate 4-epimerase/fuculose-1-phosphate aldolase
VIAESKLREKICQRAKSLFDRGLAHGSTGNISARTEDGGLLATPTGSCLGDLDPARLSRHDASGKFVSGDQPTKEMPLHAAFYDTRPARAVVHLHSVHAVAWSLTPDVDPENALPPLTAYSIMQLGKVKLLPFYLPGDPVLGEAIRGLGGRRAAVLLANHGPVVAGKDLDSACFAIEELEQTSRLALLLRGLDAKVLTSAQVDGLVRRFDVDWD